MAEDPEKHQTDATHGVTSRTPRLAEPLALLVVEGPDVDARLALKWGIFTVGKSRRCDLTLRDPGVSREHVVVERRAEALVVTDRGSTNGSFFNGARFQRIEIGLGAEIVIGKTRLRVVPDESVAHAPSATRFGAMLGESAAMRDVFSFLRRAARSDLTLLVEGETGTGKELVARGLHQASGRSGPLVVADLAGIAPHLIGSELFGHARGAFTGAERERSGVFEQADGGTLFLDELGELPLELQPSLLRALEASQVKRVGENRYRDVDIRIVAATNRRLADEVEQGRFRRDLYHRLAVFRVRLPPLRERPGDIPTLVTHFVEAVAPTASMRLPDETMVALAAHDWPGNLRELRNVVERAVALVGEDGVVTKALLGLDDDRPLLRGATTTDADLSVPFKAAKERLVEAWEREYVERLLEACEGNVSLAARRAGMHRVHLHRLIKRHQP